MPEKQNYIILMDSSSVGATQSAGLLVKQINEKISEGYVPFGNLIITTDEGGNPSFFQAMVVKPTAPAAAAAVKKPAPPADKKA